MNELIKITESDDLGQVVSARELYEFLSPSERFNSWMGRMLKYGFDVGVDFIGCKVFNTLARQELDDYALTLDTAKEISMIQRNEKGKQARRYFINCEKIARAPHLAKSIFTIQDGMVMANSRDIAKVLGQPLKQVNQDIKRFVEGFCDFVLVGHWNYFPYHKCVPPNRGGVLAKLVSANVFLHGFPDRDNAVFYLSDIVLFRYLSMHSRLENRLEMLEFFKSAAVSANLKVAQQIYNFQLPIPKGTATTTMREFFHYRMGMFSNVDHAWKVWKQYVFENDIIDNNSKSVFKQIYLEFGNRQY